MERLTEKITDKRTGEVLAYRVKCQKDVEAVQKLGRLEDFEEQGKLLKPPCVVEDTVYRINKGAKKAYYTNESVQDCSCFLKSQRICNADYVSR